jgi:hypothetical protein
MAKISVRDADTGVDAKVNANGNVQVDLEEASSIIPIDIQSRLASTIQTHNAVSVAISGSSSSAWLDCDGFDKLAVHLKNDGSTSSQVNLLWSVDGSTQIGYETILASGSSQYRSVLTDVKSRYVMVQIQNLDAALAHTMSAYAYLKA